MRAAEMVRRQETRSGDEGFRRMPPAQSNEGAAVGRTKRGITSFTCVRAAESVRRPGLARFSGRGRAHPLGNASYFRIRDSWIVKPDTGKRQKREMW